jgi:hypothetical protein
MINLRSVVRAMLPEHVRERIYYARLYSQKFGVTKGLTAYYKLLRTKSGIVKMGSHVRRDIIWPQPLSVMA